MKGEWRLVHQVEPDGFLAMLFMNGMHAFPDKEKAYSEIHRVLKSGGSFIGCFYIKGKSFVTDLLVSSVLSRKGWFTPPFETEEEFRSRLEKDYSPEEFHIDGSMVYFKAVRK